MGLSKIALLKDLYCTGNNKNGINELDRIIKKLKIIPRIKISNTHSTIHKKMQILERWGLDEFQDSWQIDCPSDNFKA